jgi:hypothetical protein
MGVAGGTGTGSAGAGSAGAHGDSRVWTVAAPITPQAEAGKDLSADVALNADGEGVVTWLRGAVVMARRYHAGTGTWDDEKIVGGKASPDGTDVGIDAAGNALIVWTDDSAPSNLSIWWSRSSADGATWSAPRRLTTTKFMTTPSLAVAANGMALVAWGENIGNMMTTRACDFRNGEWNTTINLPKAGTSEAGSDPRVAIDATGKGWLIWQQAGSADLDDWRQRIWVQRYDAGWQTNTVVMLDETDPDTSDGTVSPFVALNDAGVGAALWLERGASVPATDPRLWARRFDGTKWLRQELLAQGTLEFMPPGPQAAVGADGTIVAAWGQTLAMAYQATAARFTPGASGWDVSRSVETNNLALNANRDWVSPRLGVDGQGNGMMVWRQRLDGPIRVLPTTSRLVAGNPLWEPDNGVPLRDDHAASIATLGLGVSRNGTALAIWSYGKDTVWASVYR